MKPILFLDDDINRHKKIKPHTLHDEAYTAQEAIQKLQSKQYDIVFLDHDLGGQQYVPSEGKEETGYTVAKWITLNKPQIKLIVSHSLNHNGADNISNLLKSHNYYVLTMPFINLEKNIQEIINWNYPQDT